MLLAIIMGLTPQVADATPIPLGRITPAYEVTMTKSSKCGGTTLETKYTQTRSQVVGQILAKHGNRIVVAQDLQNALFEKLRYIDNMSVACEGSVVYVFISGVDRETGVGDQLYQLSYNREGGFTAVSGPEG